MRDNDTIHSNATIRLAVMSGGSDGGRDGGGIRGSAACRGTCVTTIGGSELDVVLLVLLSLFLLLLLINNSGGEFCRGFDIVLNCFDGRCCCEAPLTTTVGRAVHETGVKLL